MPTKFTPHPRLPCMDANTGRVKPHKCIFVHPEGSPEGTNDCKLCGAPEGFREMMVGHPMRLMSTRFFPRGWTKCPKCRGKGTVPLSPKLAAVLEQVPRNGFVDAPGVAEALRIKSTAANMRLEMLRDMKLLKRRRDGKRSWLYSLPTNSHK